MFFQTEYEFDLPKGILDGEGGAHRHGVMRLATAMDEIAAMRDPRVRANQDYAPVIVLSRVVTRLDGVEEITPETIENLFAADYTFLQNMYQTVNEAEDPVIHVQCPYCGRTFEDALNFCRGE